MPLDEKGDAYARFLKSEFELEAWILVPVSVATPCYAA